MNIDWNMWSTIGTFCACITALFIPFIQHSIEYKRKLKITVDIVNKIIDKQNNIIEQPIRVYILNTENISIYIKQCYMLIGRNKLYIHDINNPKIINIGEYIIEYFNILNAESVLKRDNYIKDINKPIRIKVIDSFGRVYYCNTHKSINELINKIENNPKWDCEE